MGCKWVLALTAFAISAGAARGAEPYPFAGVFSFLDAAAEKRYEMDKFPCLASFSIQHSDGSYTAYHIDSNEFGKGVKFLPYEVGACVYTAATNMERCKVTKGLFGESEYFVQHKPEKDGAMMVDQVSLNNPSQMSEMAVRKCPFDEAKIAPFLSQDFSTYSGDDFSWTMYRWLNFNPDLGPKIAKALGIAAQ